MYKVKNPMLGKLEINIDSKPVVIEGGKEVLLEDSIGRKLQEMQPQLQCTYIDEETAKKEAKEKAKAEAKAEKEAEAKAKAEKEANKLKDKENGKK